MQLFTLDTFRKLTAKIPDTATLVIADDDVGFSSTPVGDAEFGILHAGWSMACLQSRLTKKTNVIVLYRARGVTDDSVDEDDE